MYVDAVDGQSLGKCACVGTQNPSTSLIVSYFHNPSTDYTYTKVYGFHHFYAIIYSDILELCSQDSVHYFRIYKRIAN